MKEKGIVIFTEVSAQRRVGRTGGGESIYNERGGRCLVGWKVLSS